MQLLCTVLFVVDCPCSTPLLIKGSAVQWLSLTAVLMWFCVLAFVDEVIPAVRVRSRSGLQLR